MPTYTTNFNLAKPLVNSPVDEDLWGGELNDDMDIIDSIVYTAQRFVTRSVTTTDASTTADNHKLLLCNATSGAFTVTLPSAASAGTGFTLAIKKTDSSANTVTVDGSGAETIDGSATYAIVSQNDAVVLVCDGSNWKIISKIVAITSTYSGSSASGSTIDFTGLPENISQILVHFVNTSTTGTNPWYVQLGDSGGIENTGYTSASALVRGDGLPAVVSSTIGFIINATNALSPPEFISGRMQLNLADRSTNTWTATLSLGDGYAASNYIGGGSKALSGMLDRIRITTADTFDNGNIYISYS